MTFPGRLLSARNLFPKKHMGQNFLVDPSTAEMIVRRAGVSVSDFVFEIGAGLGALSIPLARSANMLYAVEKDRDLVEILRGVLAENDIDNVILINKNVFDVDLDAIAQKQDSKLTVFGNLPYNISSQVIIWLIKHRHLLERCIFMLQKEVARRISAAAGNGDYGRLSVMVQYCSSVKRLAKIEAHQFYPRPGVESEVIEIRFDRSLFFRAADESLFSDVVKAAFSKRRKTLKNSLAGSPLNLDGRTLDCLWKHTPVDLGRRAETVTVEEFAGLADAVKNCKERPGF